MVIKSENGVNFDQNWDTHSQHASDVMTLTHAGSTTAKVGNRSSLVDHSYSLTQMDLEKCI